MRLNQSAIEVQDARPTSGPVQESISLGHPAAIGYVFANRSSKAAWEHVIGLLEPASLQLPDRSEERWRWFIGEDGGDWIQENAPVFSAGNLCRCSCFDFRCQVIEVSNVGFDLDIFAHCKILFTLVSRVKLSLHWAFKQVCDVLGPGLAGEESLRFSVVEYRLRNRHVDDSVASSSFSSR